MLRSTSVQAQRCESYATHILHVGTFRHRRDLKLQPKILTKLYNLLKIADESFYIV